MLFTLRNFITNCFQHLRLIRFSICSFQNASIQIQPYNFNLYQLQYHIFCFCRFFWVCIWIMFVSLSFIATFTLWNQYYFSSTIYDIEDTLGHTSSAFSIGICFDHGKPSETYVFFSLIILAYHMFKKYYRAQIFHLPYAFRLMKRN